MNVPIKCAFCVVIVGTAALVRSELVPAVLSNKLGPHIHPAHYPYEFFQGALMANISTTAILVDLATPDRDGSAIQKNRIYHHDRVSYR